MVKKIRLCFYFRLGSNLRSLINKSRDPVFPIKIKLIVSNKANAKGILHAKKKIQYLI